MASLQRSGGNSSARRAELRFLSLVTSNRPHPPRQQRCCDQVFHFPHILNGHESPADGLRAAAGALGELLENQVAAAVGSFLTGHGSQSFGEEALYFHAAEDSTFHDDRALVGDDV